MILQTELLQSPDIGSWLSKMTTRMSDHEICC